jgi:hypothetical protein
VTTFTATAGQTTFVPTSGYSLGYCDVFLNGVKLVSGTDYTAANGTTVVLAAGAAVGDSVEVVAFIPRGLSDGYTKAETDALLAAIEVTPTQVSDKVNSSTGYFDLPAGTTAQRPVSPSAGAARFNTTTGSVEFFDGTNWISTNLIPTVNSVTGTIYVGTASTLTLSLSNATEFVTVRFTEGGVLVADVPNVAVISGSASVSVPSAVFNQTAGDTIAVSVINQDGTPSSNAITRTVTALPTGGTITTSGNFRIHTFTSSSSLVVPSGFSATAEYLVVAGGGGGGGSTAGGGGAGGVIFQSGPMEPGTYPAVVGAGGTGGRIANAGAPNNTNGQNTTFFGLTAIGGGRGYSASNSAAPSSVAASGGSGGGGGGHGPNTAPSSSVGGSGTSGQGFAGGNGLPSNAWGGAGGGGAGGVGDPQTDNMSNGAGTSTPRRGGPGVDHSSRFPDSGTNASNTTSGTRGWFGGGGAGGVTNSGQSFGGAGGGGNGADGGTFTPTSGLANTGGGGGGGGFYQSGPGGGNGGSGIVIIRYQL